MAKKNQLTKSDYLPEHEAVALHKGLHKDGEYLWEFYVQLSIYTGLRVSDVLHMTWDKVLKRKSFIVTEQKTQKTKRVEMNPQLCNYVWEAYCNLGKPNPVEFIFANPKTHEPYTPQYINRLAKMWKYTYRLTIENFSTHTFRKTFARLCYDKSIDKTDALVHINEMFQHSSLLITKRYLGITSEEIKKMYNLITI